MNNKDDIINYWIDTSNQDYKTFEHLFESKDYSWCLFMGHLVIEKLLKAIFVNNTNNIMPPKSHDLLFIAEKAGLDLDKTKSDLLDLISTFNISTRYPDYKKSFYKMCTREYTSTKVKQIEELRLWLISLIQVK